MSVASNSSSKSYREAAIEFIQQIRLYSPAAADCLEQIQVQYGTRAAYLAAFALIDVKHRQIKQQRNPSTQDLHAFTYCDEMRESAEALQLYEEAAGHLLAGFKDDQPALR